ncbi:hypothetical protein WG906_09470 [Pedobacter sp. P351]|uniref:hypothetical protein n=1 Tax=Pedobacter superstes TaxID=3133441 RepID=UPI0030ACAF4A
MSHISEKILFDMKNIILLKYTHLNILTLNLPVMTYPLIFIISFLFSSCGESKNVSNEADETLSIDSVIKKSEQSYASLKTYLDSGKVISDFYSGSHPHKSAKIFRTAYSATEGFNFEYFEPNKSNSLHTLNKKGETVKTWWGVTNELTTDKTFSMAIASMTGVSSGAATLIPRLLFPKKLSPGRNIYNSFVPDSSGFEMVNGLPCYKISGKDRLEGKITVWVAKSDFLIRKVENDRIVNPKTYANVDSMLRSGFQRDSVRIQKLADQSADPQKKAMLLKKLKESSATRSTVLKQLSARPARSPFSVKTTTFIYPYTQKVLNKELFSFRPHREVPL